MKNKPKLVAIMFALSVTSAFAADWPWLYGPRRDHTSEQKKLLRTWPQAGPAVLWTVPMAAGFGGPAVSGGKVYVLDRDEKVGDTLRVLDLATGKELWTFAYDAPGSFMFAGSRTMPTVDGKHVYTVGPMGDLHAISLETRKPAWRANIWKDFGGGAELPRWAIVQNPLIYGDLLIVAPQTPEVGVVAYDKLTGSVRWKSAALSGIPGLRDALDRQGRRGGSARDDHRAPQAAAATRRAAASTAWIRAAARCCGPTPTGSASSPFRRRSTPARGACSSRARTAPARR